MAVAFDAFSNSAGEGSTTASQTWTHTPGGTPRGVIVLVVGNAGSGADEVTGVTYGSLTLTEAAGSPNTKTTGETGCVHAFTSVAGDSIPTGAQTVTVTCTGATIKRASAITLTAGADVEIVDVDATIDADSSANPSVTLSLAGRTSFACIAFHSGQNAPGSITPLASWTSRLENDFGTQNAGFYTYDTIGTADVTAGWTQAAEDACAIALAVSEIVTEAPSGGEGMNAGRGRRAPGRSPRGSVLRAFDALTEGVAPADDAGYAMLVRPGRREVQRSRVHLVSALEGSVGGGAGDLLWVYFSCDGVETPTWPAGWTQLFLTTRTSPDATHELRYRVADGTEGSSITITTTSQESASAAGRVPAGTYTGVPEVSATSASFSENPNPNTLSPSWGSAKVEWWALATADDNGAGATTVDTYPTSYADDQHGDSTGGTDHVIHMVASRENEVATEDPGLYTTSVATGWMARTMAIQGTAGAFPNSTVVFSHTTANATDHVVSLPEAGAPAAVQDPIAQMRSRRPAVAPRSRALPIAHDLADVVAAPVGEGGEERQMQAVTRPPLVRRLRLSSQHLEAPIQEGGEERQSITSEVKPLPEVRRTRMSSQHLEAPIQEGGEERQAVTSEVKPTPEVRRTRISSQHLEAPIQEGGEEQQVRVVVHPIPHAGPTRALTPLEDVAPPGVDAGGEEHEFPQRRPMGAPKSHVRAPISAPEEPEAAPVGEGGEEHEVRLRSHAPATRRLALSSQHLEAPIQEGGEERQAITAGVRPRPTVRRTRLSIDQHLDVPIQEGGEEAMPIARPRPLPNRRRSAAQQPVLDDDPGEAGGGGMVLLRGVGRALRRAVGFVLRELHFVAAVRPTVTHGAAIPDSAPSQVAGPGDSAQTADMPGASNRDTKIPGES